MQNTTQLQPIETDNRTIQEVIDDLNRKIKSAGIEFGENKFSFQDYITDLNPDDPFPPYRWIHCSAVHGSNEGYYVHICLMPTRFDKNPAILLAVAKTWTRENALEIAAAATRILCF